VNTAEISKMSVTEKLQTMEALWESFSNDPIEHQAPVWHGDILRTRTEKIKNKDAKFITLSELKLKHGK